MPTMSRQDDYEIERYAEMETKGVCLICGKKIDPLYKYCKFHYNLLLKGKITHYEW